MLAAIVLCLGLFSAPDGVTFSGDWESALTGPGTWRKAQIMGPDRFQRVSDVVRQGQYAARVEVRPGDDPIHSSGERAEVLVMTDRDGRPFSENESSGTQFYAFSVRLAPDWQSPTAAVRGKWAIVFQLHGPDDLRASPSVAVSVQEQFALDLHGGDLDDRQRALWHKSFPFTDSRLVPGKWVDLVLKIRFAKDHTGTVDVWRRDEGQTAFTKVLEVRDVPTLQYSTRLGGVKPHYWKHGLYRSKQTTITNVLWLDGLTRGDSFEAVVKAAFGDSGPIRQPD